MDISSILGALGIGGGTKEIPVDPVKQYPTEDDARFAQANDYSYGQPNAAYMDGQAGQVLGTKVTGTNKVPLPPARDDHTAAREAWVSTFIPVSGAAVGGTSRLTGDNTAPTENATPDGPVSQEDKDKIAMAMTRAQLAANRIPVAALGLDGHGTTFDTSGVETNIVGLYNRNTDKTYANLTDPSTLVHEAIHRGLNKLRNEPGFPDQGNRASHPQMDPDGEEYLVRHIMENYAGDPEQGTMDKQQKRVAQINPPNPSDIAAINALAVKLLGAKRPMGPR